MSFTGKINHYLGMSQDKWIISAKQKGEILALVESESGWMGFMKILSVIGAVCVWIWVLLVIASNWSDFPRLLQLLLSIMLPVVSLWLGYYFTYTQRELLTLWNAFSLLGWLLIGASIALIGQIYNLDGTVGSLLRMWFILSLPLVFIFKLKTLAVLSTALFYGTIFYYTTEVYLDSWKDEKYILAVFSVISASLTVAAYMLNSVLNKKYNYLLMPVCAISLKILFVMLFLPTVENYFVFLGDSFFAEIIHNLLFLWTLVFTMWWANKNHEILLRHATFIWIGVYILVKYFSLFNGYLSAGIFFITTGLFIIALVYSFIKINNYLNSKSTNGK